MHACATNVLCCSWTRCSHLYSRVILVRTFIYICKVPMPTNFYIILQYYASLFLPNWFILYFYIQLLKTFCFLMGWARGVFCVAFYDCEPHLNLLIAIRMSFVLCQQWVVFTNPPHQLLVLTIEQLISLQVFSKRVSGNSWPKLILSYI